jgi:hypothetical protein
MNEQLVTRRGPVMICQAKHQQLQQAIEQATSSPRQAVTPGAVHSPFQITHISLLFFSRAVHILRQCRVAAQTPRQTRR